MKFTVKRSNWYRGHGNGLDTKPHMENDSKLLRADGKRCCIGFVGQQCGYSDEVLLEIGTIQAVSADHSKWPKWMFEDEQVYGHLEPKILKAYITNDSADYTDEQREARLKQIFSENGDEIEFVD